MNDRTLLRTGVIGTVIAALCCFTPVLVVLLGAVRPVGRARLAGLRSAPRPGVLHRADDLRPLSASQRQGPNIGARLMSMDCCATDTANGRYDLAVVGAGSAGFSAAITAAEQGAQVAPGRARHDRRHVCQCRLCAVEGVDPGDRGRFIMRTRRPGSRASSWPRAVWRIGAPCARRRTNWSHRCGKRSIWICCRPTMASPIWRGRRGSETGGVTVDGAPIDAGKIIIATGSREVVPPIPGIADVPYLTSTSAFELERLPDSMIVIGGGYVGLRAGAVVRPAPA